MRFRISSLAVLALLAAAVGGVPGDEHALDEIGVTGSSSDVQAEVVSEGSSRDAPGTKDEEEYPPQVAARIPDQKDSFVRPEGECPSSFTPHRIHCIGPAWKFSRMDGVWTPGSAADALSHRAGGTSPDDGP